MLPFSLPLLVVVVVNLTCTAVLCTWPQLWAAEASMQTTARLSGGSRSTSQAPTPNSLSLLCLLQFVIDGNLVDSISGETFETLDPRSGDKIHDVADGRKQDVDKAVDAARRAFDEGPWAKLGGKVLQAPDLPRQNPHATHRLVLDRVYVDACG